MAIDNQPAGTDAIIAQRRLRALELRAAGASYRAIGAQLRVSGKTAYEDVQAVLAELSAQTFASADEYRTMELERLDALTMEATRILRSPHPLISGGKVLSGFTDEGKPIGLTDDGPKLQAIDRLLRISESRRKLLGLDAQSPIIVERPYVLTESERSNRLIELLDTARTRRSGQVTIDVTPDPGDVAE